MCTVVFQNDDKHPLIRDWHFRSDDPAHQCVRSRQSQSTLASEDNGDEERRRSGQGVQGDSHRQDRVMLNKMHTSYVMSVASAGFL